MNNHIKALLVLAGLFLFDSPASACEVYQLKSKGIKFYCHDFNSLKNSKNSLTQKIKKQVVKLNSKIESVDIFPLEVFIFPYNYFSNTKIKAFFNSGRIFLSSLEENEINFSEQAFFHELVHLAIYKLTLGKAPTWLDEGLALYLEDKNNLEVRSDLDECKLKNSTGNSLAYCQPQAFYALSKLKVEKIIKKYGFKKLLNFLVLLPRDVEFEIIFKEYFGNDSQLDIS